MKSYLLGFVLTFLISFQTNSQENKDNEIAILFIGNSLTYYNNLPKLVVNYAFSNKGINIKTEMIAHPNYAIEDHWRDGKIQKQISSKSFDYVIIQQGPSSQKLGKNMLIEYGKKLNVICKENNAKLCYFMVWPSIHYYQTFDKVIENHAYAAKINNSLLLSVGTHWKNFMDEHNDYSFYGSDGFHPSVKGSKEAAKIIVETMFPVN